MKLTADVAHIGRLTHGTRIAEGAIQPQDGIPVTLNFDHNRVIGTASIRADGTAHIDIADGFIVAEPCEWSIGFRPTDAHKEGDTLAVDRAEVLTIGLVTRPQHQQNPSSPTLP
jgi:hypothetical protein